MSQHASIGHLIRDIMDLCELQIQLLAVDSQAAKKRFVFAAACGITAAALGGSALTVALFGLGYWLGEATELSIAGGLLIVGLGMMALVGLLLLLCVRAIRSAADAMSETKAELGENLRWIKATLVTPQSSHHENFPDDSIYTTHVDSSPPFPAR